MSSNSELKTWLLENKVSSANYVCNKLNSKKINLETLLSSEKKQLDELLGDHGARLPSMYLSVLMKAIKNAPNSKINPKNIAKSPKKATNNAKKTANDENETKTEAISEKNGSSNAETANATETTEVKEATLQSDKQNNFKSEADLLNILKENFDDISNAVTNTQQTIQGFRKNIQTIENDISIEFERMINILNEKKQSLLSEISKIKKKENKILDDQCSMLKKYRDNLSQTKKEFITLSKETGGNNDKKNKLAQMNKLVSDNVNELHSNLDNLTLYSDCQIAIQNSYINQNISNKLNSNILDSAIVGSVHSAVSDESLSLVTSPPSEHSSIGEQSSQAASHATANASVVSQQSHTETIHNIESYFMGLTGKIESLNVEYLNKNENYKQFTERANGGMISSVNSARRSMFGMRGTMARDDEKQDTSINDNNNVSSNNDNSIESALHNGLESLQISYKLNENDKLLLSRAGGDYLSEFDSKYKTRNIELSNNNTIATKISGFNEDYIVLNMDPISSGVHCWRIHHRDDSNIRWCIIPFTKKGLSYDKAKGYGLSNFNQMFRFGKMQYETGKSQSNSKNKNRALKTDVWRGKLIDIMLDLESDPENKKIRFRCPEFDSTYDETSIRSGLSGRDVLSDNNEIENDNDTGSQYSLNSRNSMTSRVSKTSRTSRTSKLSRRSADASGRGDKKLFKPSISLKSTIEYEKNVYDAIERAKNETNEITIDKLPSNQKWLLHFTLGKADAEIKVRKIPTQWYGKYVEKVNFMV